MFTNTNFSYDSIPSENFGLMLVNLQAGTQNQPFAVGRSIVEEKIGSQDQPYFYHFDYQPLQFTATFARMEEWTRQDKMDIVRWLFKRDYKPFISTDDIGIVYNCIAVDSPQKILVGNEQRMIEVTFRCDAPWAWTPTYTQSYDLRANSSGTTITMENRSNVVDWYSPEIQIKKIGAGNVSFLNMQDSGRISTFTGLLNNEIIYMNTKLRQLYSDQANRYPLLHFNREWPRLAYGQNVIQVVGECEITTRMKYPIGI